MGTVRPLFDSDILIRALIDPAGSNARSPLLDWQEQSISIITWIEVMAGTNAANEQKTRKFLATFTICEATAEVAESAVKVRQAMKLKLPDAVIYATALATGRTLVTYNTRDFPRGTKSVLIPG